MRIAKISAAVAALAAPLALHAAEPAKPAPAAPASVAEKPMTPEQQKANYTRGVKIMSLFSAALQNKEVPEDQKGYLFSCIYNNKLSNVSFATGEVLAKNPKLDANDAKVIYQVAATVCGVNKAPSVVNAQKAPSAGSANDAAKSKGR